MNRLPFCSALLLIALAASSCDSKPEPAPQTSQKTQTRLSDATFQMIIPLPNGDAYAVGGLLGDQVWLLRNNEAVRVKEVPHFSAEKRVGPLRPFEYQQAPAFGLNDDQ